MYNKNNVKLKLIDVPSSQEDWLLEYYKDFNTSIALTGWEGPVMVDDHLTNLFPELETLSFEDEVEGFSTYQGDKNISEIEIELKNLGFKVDVIYNYKQ